MEYCKAYRELAHFFKAAAAAGAARVPAQLSSVGATQGRR